MFLTPPALSQTDVAPPASPPTLIGEEAPPHADSEALSLGGNTSPRPAANAAEEPEVPAPIVATPSDIPGVSTERFQDWVLECFIDSDTCQISHRVLADGERQIVVVLAMLSSSHEGPASVQIAVPLGVSTRAGIRLTIGTEYQANIEIDRCTPQGCIVDGVASDALLSAMRRGQSGQLDVLNDAGTSITLPFSLMGFSASYAEMIDRNATE